MISGNLDIGYIFWSVVISIGCLVYITCVILNYRGTVVITSTANIRSPDPKIWPKVSLIIPACNEADTLVSAMESKLESDYPNLEIILINDRSSDSTGEIINRLAEKNDVIKPVHITELPDGWMGKQWAMQRGVEIASGDYYLFSDADVHYSRDVIRKALAFSEERRLDQLGILPKLWSHKFVLDIVKSTFIRTYGISARFWGLDKPNVETYTGVGAFNLVRKSAFDKTDGFHWLKLDPADDVALGLMIKRSGGKVWLANGMNDLNVTWYRNLREMSNSLEKVAYISFGNFSFIRTVLLSILFIVVELFPFIGLLAVSVSWLQWMCVFMLVLALFNSIRMNRWIGGPVLPAILFPVGTILFAFMMIKGGYLGWRRKGIYWRGTFYPEEQLKGGKRVSVI